MPPQTIPIYYEIFRNAPSSLDSDGGPWFYERQWPDTFMQQGTRYVPWCEGNCIHIFSHGVCNTCQSAFSLLVNVTVDMMDYPGATSLAYNWEYSPAFCDSLSATGQLGEISLTIGDQVASDSLSSVPCPDSNGTNSPGWSGNPVTHSGNTTLSQFRSTGYIPIIITFLKTTYTADKNLTWYFKGIHFNITTPVGGATESPVPSTSSTPSTPPKSNVGVIVPSVVAALAALVVLIVFLFWLKYRRDSLKLPSDNSYEGQKQPAIGGVMELHGNDSVPPLPGSHTARSSAANGEVHSSPIQLTRNQGYSRQSMDPTRNSSSNPASPSVSPRNLGHGRNQEAAGGF